MFFHLIISPHWCFRFAVGLFVFLVKKWWVTWRHGVPLFDLFCVCYVNARYIHSFVDDMMISQRGVCVLSIVGGLNCLPWSVVMIAWNSISMECLCHCIGFYFAYENQWFSHYKALFRQLPLSLSQAIVLTLLDTAKATLFFNSKMYTVGHNSQIQSNVWISLIILVSDVRGTFRFTKNINTTVYLHPSTRPCINGVVAGYDLDWW